MSERESEVGVVVGLIYDCAMNRVRMPCAIFLVLSAILLQAGCVGYRLGSTLPPGIRNVHVPTFVNKTQEPLIENDATRAVVQELQRDGTLAVASAGDADVVLTVTLTGYRIEGLRFDKDRPKVAMEHRMVMSADLRLEARATGKVLFERSVEGEAVFQDAGDMVSAKRGALPVATADLAHDIVESVVEYW